MKKCNIEAKCKIFISKLNMPITSSNKRFSQFDDLKMSMDLFCDPINSFGFKYQIKLCEHFFTTHGAIFKYLNFFLLGLRNIW